MAADGQAREVLTPLMRPWRDLPDYAAPRLQPRRKKTFWQSVFQFMFDYNRY